MLLTSLFLSCFQSPTASRRHLHPSNVAQEGDAAQAEDPAGHVDRADGQASSGQARNLAFVEVHRHDQVKKVSELSVRSEVQTIRVIFR